MQQGNLIEKKSNFCSKERCLTITETFERKVYEDDMLRRVERIKAEEKNLDAEIERLQAVKESMNHERKELLKIIAQQLPSDT